MRTQCPRSGLSLLMESYGNTCTLTSCCVAPAASDQAMRLLHATAPQAFLFLSLDPFGVGHLAVNSAQGKSHVDLEDRSSKQ